MDSEYHPIYQFLDDPLKTEKVSLALKKMFTGRGYFSICTVQEVGEIVNPYFSRSMVETLQPLHCSDWPDISGNMLKHIVDVMAKSWVHSSISLHHGLSDFAIEEDLAKRFIHKCSLPTVGRPQFIEDMYKSLLGESRRVYEEPIPEPEYEFQERDVETPVGKKTFLAKLGFKGK